MIEIFVGRIIKVAKQHELTFVFRNMILHMEL